MRIREITVGDLPAFIRSGEYVKLQPKPITPLRAVSQFNNPHARKKDVALLFASENDTLLAFVGLLPHAVPGDSEPVYSNTGWWVHPSRGRKLGLPLFLKAFRLSNQRMFFTDSPAYTKNILEKTGLFTYLPPQKGMRLFMRFYSGKWLGKKRKNCRAVPLFSLSDALLNAICSLRFLLLLNRNALKQYSLQSTTELDKEHDAFIKRHSGSAYLKQGIAKLNWMVRHPWITSQKDTPEITYPFSHRAEKFNQEFLIIRKEKTIQAILFLSVRDGHATIPFAFFEKNSLSGIAHMLWSHLISKKTDSLIVFRKELQSALTKSGHFWLFKKNIIRFAGHSNAMQPFFPPEGYFQDGDGDAAFT